jgi:hypothetical protein
VLRFRAQVFLSALFLDERNFSVEPPEVTGRLQQGQDQPQASFGQPKFDFPWPANIPGAAIVPIAATTDPR